MSEFTMTDEQLAEEAAEEIDFATKSIYRSNDVKRIILTAIHRAKEELEQENKRLRKAIELDLIRFENLAEWYGSFSFAEDVLRARAALSETA